MSAILVDGPGRPAGVRSTWDRQRVAAIATGAAAGAAVRWAVLATLGSGRFPWPVLAVNVAGSLLLGVALAEEWRHPSARLALHDAAGVGALARAEAGRRWNRHDGLAVGTLAVNVTGSFLLGLLRDVAPPMLTVFGVGGLGAYTTFSSFARDAVALAERRRLALAGVYVVASCVLGLAAAAAGVAIAET